MEPFMPPPPSCTAWLVHDAGSTTRKLMGRPLELVSVGAITPSMEQKAGALPVAGTHHGAARVTPATASPIDATGMVEPSWDAVQSSADKTRGVLTADCVCWESPMSAVAKINATSAAASVPMRVRVGRFIY